MKKLREEFEEFKELTGWSWRDTVMYRFAMLWTSYFLLRLFAVSMGWARGEWTGWWDGLYFLAIAAWGGWVYRRFHLSLAAARIPFPFSKEV